MNLAVVQGALGEHSFLLIFFLSTLVDFGPRALHLGIPVAQAYSDCRQGRSE